MRPFTTLESENQQKSKLDFALKRDLASLKVVQAEEERKIGTKAGCGSKTLKRCASTAVQSQVQELTPQAKRRSETPSKEREIREMARRSQRKPLMSKSGKDIHSFLASLTDKVPRKRSAREPEEAKGVIRDTFDQPKRKLKSALKQSVKRDLTPYQTANRSEIFQTQVFEEKSEEPRRVSYRPLNDPLVTPKMQPKSRDVTPSREMGGKVESFIQRKSTAKRGRDLMEVEESKVDPGFPSKRKNLGRKNKKSVAFLDKPKVEFIESKTEVRKAQYDPELIHHRQELKIRKSFSIVKDSFIDRLTELRNKYQTVARERFNKKFDYCNEINQELKFQESVGQKKEELRREREANETFDEAEEEDQFSEFAQVAAEFAKETLRLEKTLLEKHKLEEKLKEDSLNFQLKSQEHLQLKREDASERLSQTMQEKSSQIAAMGSQMIILQKLSRTKFLLEAEIPMSRAKRAFKTREICVYKDFQAPGLTSLSLTTQEVPSDCRLILKDFKTPEICENIVNQRIKEVASEPSLEESSVFMKSFDFLFGTSPQAGDMSEMALVSLNRENDYSSLALNVQSEEDKMKFLENSSYCQFFTEYAENLNGEADCYKVSDYALCSYTNKEELLEHIFIRQGKLQFLQEIIENFHSV